MASGPRKRSRPNRIRYRIEADCETEAEKMALARRINHVRRLLFPSGSCMIDNGALLNAMCDIVEREAAQGVSESREEPQRRSFMRSSGIYTGDDTPEDSKLFICERHTLADLLQGLKSPCSCGMTTSPWDTESCAQKGHVLRMQFHCRRCQRVRRTWSSSRILAGHFLINQKVVHGFTCAGVRQTQYIKFSQFSGLGSVKNCYIRHVYNRRGYMDLVFEGAEGSMQEAVEKVHSLPGYEETGEWVITDARHDSTANAYHTTVPCLSGRTQKIVGISTLSRNDHATPQTREVSCTKDVLPEVIARGLNVVEVAHDIQRQVSSFVRQLGLINSYDTWHGTKNVAKQMLKITQGRVRDRGVTWFPELVDKRKSVKTHLYWAMKNCGESGDVLRSLIDSIPKHFEGDHSCCHRSSPCHRPHYEPSKVLVANTRATQKLTQTLHGTFIYRNADEFCRCRDTYAVESFNHMMLCYVPKLIHFSSHTFKMRMSLAVMDWNENVNRPHTNQRKVFDLRRPDRRTAMKVLVAKSYNFVDKLWQAYISRNTTNLQPTTEEVEDSEEEEEGQELIEDDTVVTDCGERDDEDEEIVETE